MNFKGNTNLLSHEKIHTILFRISKLETLAL